ncbi:MAG: farnesyl diphosphate synthase [Pseudomonadales bacterium]
MEGNFESRVPAYRRRTESVMATSLPRPGEVPSRLHDAITYAVKGEGKRIRPLLVYATGEMLNIEPTILDFPAAALEMIHTYSLVHDDLPAMDDDDLRRGRPTLHRQFDDATAILVGDALQTMAFQVLAEAPVDEAVKCRWISILARAAGPEGMAGGQSMDLDRETGPLDPDELETMHRMKSGSLITAAVDMATCASPTLDELKQQKLLEFADNIGMAFQIRDDVLDVESSTDALGKPQGSDQARGRSTYVSLLGLDNARTQFESYHKRACWALSEVGENNEALLWLADYIVKRSS